MNASCVYTTEKSFTLGEPPLVPKVGTHSPFVSFETTKGEIRVKNAGFRDDFEGFGFGNHTPHPPILGKTFPNKTVFLRLPLGMLPIKKKGKCENFSSRGPLPSNYFISGASRLLLTPAGTLKTP